MTELSSIFVSISTVHVGNFHAIVKTINSTILCIIIRNKIIVTVVLILIILLTLFHYSELFIIMTLLYMTSLFRIINSIMYVAGKERNN